MPKLYQETHTIFEMPLPMGLSKFSREFEGQYNFGVEMILCNGLYLIMGLILFIYMAVVGSVYSGIYSDEYPQEVYCSNGVALWLFVIGIFLAVDLVIKTSFQTARFIMRRRQRSIVHTDGSKAVTKASCVYGVCSLLLEIGLLVWGCVIVLGQWSTWTSDYDEFLNNWDLNHCSYAPMMIAFIFLIVRIVLIPVVLLILMCSSCCLAYVMLPRVRQGNQTQTGNV